MPHNFNIMSVSPADLLKLVKAAGGQRAFARANSIARTTLQDRLYLLRKQPFEHRPIPVAKRVGEKRGVRRYILTSAQDSTLINEKFLSNLEAYRDWLQQFGGCELMVAGFTYNKALFEDHSKHSVLWPDRIKPYMVNERIRIADKIDFCGEMNTLPTATSPLDGLHTYTQDRWGIFPHAKIQLISVPVMKFSPPKQIMTTGAVTMPNYVPKKAGVKASFHHRYGAVLVEVDQDHDHFCRHLIGDEDGSFYDLDCLVENGEVSHGHALTALTPGDIHVSQIDPVVARAIFGHAPTGARTDGMRDWTSSPDCMLDVLRPEYTFIHDVCDFHVRNHHNIADPHFRFKAFTNGNDSVENELQEVAYFLDTLQRRYPTMKVIVVESNHDQALLKWLKSADYRIDPANARFFLQCQLACYVAIEDSISKFSIFEHVSKNLFPFRAIQDVQFLQEDDSFVIGDVEHANHGHRGPNGSRGGVMALVRVAPKMTIGHVHAPAIQDGLYAGGTTSKRNLGYNAGPSSWAPTLVAQYANGKRALITLQGPKWRVH